jgi:predicted Ser/Thr protein kinase
VSKVPQSTRRDGEIASSISETEFRGPGVRVFQQGGWGKADILLFESPGRKAIIKDFNKKILPVRWYGRWQIRREASIYRKLSGIPGVPQYFGRIGKNAMAIEYVEGERISHWKRRELPPELFARLRNLIDAIHSRGIVHIDLRKRDNILIGPSGEVFIIDFNASFRFEPGSRRARWFLPTLRKIDHFGFLKWKAALAPAQLSEAERHAFRRMSFLRRFWIFK